MLHHSTLCIKTIDKISVYRHHSDFSLYNCPTELPGQHRTKRLMWFGLYILSNTFEYRQRPIAVLSSCFRKSDNFQLVHVHIYTRERFSIRLKSRVWLSHTAHWLSLLSNHCCLSVKIWGKARCPLRRFSQQPRLIPPRKPNET